MINEQFARSLNERKKYSRTRHIVEQMVRETLMKKINEESKAAQVRDILSDPTVNKSALARQISGLSGNDDARRSEISKIARGEWTPDTSIQNDILHKLSSTK